ncbi:hypothetical protein CF326_g7782 [Tilletia indica]|nr:hypothetical protein CF326_g7782 [Tilletia indica]
METIWYVYPHPHAGVLCTSLGTDKNTYLFSALEDGADEEQQQQQQKLHNQATGTVDRVENPHVVSDSEHTEEDEDDGLGARSGDVDEDMVDQAIRDVTTVAVATAANHIMPAGQDRQPPAYTVPSFRERGDNFLSASRNQCHAGNKVLLESSELL